VVQSSKVPGAVLATLLTGVVLNALNSSTITVALVPIQRAFGVGVATSTWLISGFYLTAAIGQPVMGRLADLFQARRVFVFGLCVVFVASSLASFAPTFCWLVVARVLLAVGTSTAFPAALILMRQSSTDDTARSTAAAPSGAMAVITVGIMISLAIGPVLGGFLVTLAGWRLIFLINIPITTLGIVMGIRVLPSGPVSPPRRRSLWHAIDLPGIVLFCAALTGLLIFVLSLADRALWWLAPISAVLAVVFLFWERRAPTPFLDFRGLAANGRLSAVLGQQLGFNLAFYFFFLGLPLWLASVRHYSADEVGLLMLPIAIMAIATTPAVAFAIPRLGTGTVLVAGSAVVLLGALLMLLVGDSTPIAVLVLIAMTIGISDAAFNLGGQSGLYEASTPERMGASGGLYQMLRYLSGITTTSVLGVVLDREMSSRGLHVVGLIATGLAVGLLLLSYYARRAGARRLSSATDSRVDSPVLPQGYEGSLPVADSEGMTRHRPSRHKRKSAT
jgi:MFS family permease